MEYSIQGLSKLAGISTRTLRYYEEMQLLVPKRKSNGYRIYGEKEIEKLQRIMFFRELGMALQDIKDILEKNEDHKLGEMEKHLGALYLKREQLENLIVNVEKTIHQMKGEYKMSDQERFEGFQEKALRENEKMYGKEIREKYGEEIVTNSNKKWMGLTKEEYEEVQALSEEINTKLKVAFMEGDFRSPLAQEVCALHEKWLKFFWNNYSKELHLSLTQMYVEDPRFTAYYDKIATGAAIFLNKAMQVYCK